MDLTFLKYVRIASPRGVILGPCFRRDGKEGYYFREAGGWGLKSRFIGGVHIICSRGDRSLKHLNGKELVEVTKSEHDKCNGL